MGSKIQFTIMKLSIFIALGLVSYAASQTTSTCGADFTTLPAIITNLNKTFYTAYNFTNPKLPLNVTDVNSNRASIDVLNDIAVQWSYSSANITAILQQVFTNLSLAVKSNKTADYTALFDNVTAAIAAAIGNSVSPGPIFGSQSGIPAYASQFYQNIINNFTNLFNSTAILISSSETLSGFLNNTGVTVTPGNVSKYLMSPTAVAIFLSGLTNLTNTYMGFVTNVTRDMNNTYTMYKSNDATLKDIVLNNNFTLNNMTQTVISINTTFYNVTMTNLLAMNSSIAKFKASVAPTLQSNSDFQANMSLVDDAMFSIADSFLNNIVPSMDMSLFSSYLNNMNNTLQTYFNYLTLEFPSQYRPLIFQAFNTTGGNNNCSYNLTTNAEKAFADFGGAKAFFNCSSYERVVLNETQAIVNGTMAAIMMDFNTHMAMFNSCNTLKTILPNGVNISASECVALAVNGLGQFSYAIQQEIQSMSTQIRGFLSISATRYISCFAARNMNINYTLGYLTQTFLNCSNITIGR